MYNVTCLVTGKTENLKMYAVRNDRGEMVGWIFLHESVEFNEGNVDINWKFNATIKNQINE
jgi:hypothetical protein